MVTAISRTRGGAFAILLGLGLAVAPALTATYAAAVPGARADSSAAATPLTITWADTAGFFGGFDSSSYTDAYGGPFDVANSRSSTRKVTVTVTTDAKSFTTTKVTLDPGMGVSFGPYQRGTYTLTGDNGMTPNPAMDPATLMVTTDPGPATTAPSSPVPAPSNSGGQPSVAPRSSAVPAAGGPSGGSGTSGGSAGGGGSSPRSAPAPGAPAALAPGGILAPGAVGAFGLTGALPNIAPLPTESIPGVEPNLAPPEALASRGAPQPSGSTAVASRGVGLTSSPSGRGLGLPAALAAVALAGMVAAIAKVLLSYSQASPAPHRPLKPVEVRSA